MRLFRVASRPAESRMSFAFWGMEMLRASTEVPHRATIPDQKSVSPGRILLESSTNGDVCTVSFLQTVYLRTRPAGILRTVMYPFSMSFSEVAAQTKVPWKQMESISLKAPCK